MSREKTWYDLRIEWERRMRREFHEFWKTSQMRRVVKDQHEPQPWDNVDLGPRCEWSDLHVIACAHCQGVPMDSVPWINGSDTSLAQRERSHMRTVTPVADDVDEPLGDLMDEFELPDMEGVA